MAAPAQAGGLRTWRAAMRDALYGPAGFYTRGESPAAHYRTSVHASPLFAAAVGELLRRVDTALGGPDPVDLVDVGAGGGELLSGVWASLVDPAGADLRDRLRLTAVERVPRPVDPGGPRPAVRWVTEIPALTGLLVANEWLDNVPLDVVVDTRAGPRVLLVDRSGRERVGGPAGLDEVGWMDRWWPRRPTSTRGGKPARVEVGRPRDQAWASAITQVRRGAAVAIDYAHLAAGRPESGTLTGYRAGRLVPPVPDGSRDLTAHVALDACAAAGRSAGATATALIDQRGALGGLGVRGGRPPIALARTDPVGYLRALERAGEAAELTDPAGLGGFGWLVQAVGVPLPLAT